MIVQLSASEKSIGQAVAWTVGAGVVPALVLVAGFSLWRGGGRASGTLTVLLLTAETAFYTPAMSSMTIPMVGSLAVRLALFFVIANGVRGAFALSHADYDGEVREVFK